MCDIGSITAANSFIPGGTQQTDLGTPSITASGDFTTGELLEQGAGVLGELGSFQEASNIADQREKRAGQILQATKQTIQLKALEQGRALGAKKAAIGRAGVGISGSAAKFISQQERLDEMALEAAKQRGVLEIGGELSAAQQQKTVGGAALGKAFAKGAELGTNVFKGFDLG